MHAHISYRLSFPPALSQQVCLLRISIGLGSLSLSVGWRRARAAMLLRPVSPFPTVVEHVWAEGTWSGTVVAVLSSEKGIRKKNADQEIYIIAVLDGRNL